MVGREHPLPTLCYGELCQDYYYCGGEFRPELAKGYAKIVTNAAIANLKYDNLDLPKLQYEEINNLIDKIINKKCGDEFEKI